MKRVNFGKKKYEGPRTNFHLLPNKSVKILFNLISETKLDDDENLCVDKVKYSLTERVGQLL